jgi:predicted permease
MRRLRAVVRRLGSLFHKRRDEQELAEELESHLQMHIEDNLRAGLTPQEARRQALIKLGGLEQTKELCRDRRGLPFLETFLQDLRYGARMLAKNPGFTAVAVLTLALGIGPNTAIFSVVNAVLLRPLSYKDPDRLVEISEKNSKLGVNWFAVAPANFLDWQQQNHVFESMAIFGLWSEELYLAGEGPPEELQGRRVSASYFPLLGVQPILGRTFLPEEDGPGHHVVVLTYAFWQHRFASDPKVIGRQLAFNGESYTIVGVMPKGFQTLAAGYSEKEREHLWLPSVFERFAPTERDAKGMEVIGRLKPGASVAQARVEMEAIARQLEQAYPKTNDGWGVNVRPLFDEVTQNEFGTRFRPALLLLMGAVGLVLLIACVNVASLLLARSVTRQREIAVRNALGASRLRLIRQLLTESVLLTTLGGGLGILLAVASVPALIALSPADIPRLDEARVDFIALTFTLAVALLTGLLCGLVPALSSSKPDLNGALKEGSRGATRGLAQQRTQRLLVVGEIALAVVLLTGAGLMIRSFLRLHNEDLGFEPENVLTVQVSLPRLKYADITKPTAKAPEGKAPRKWWTVRPNVSAFVRQALERLEHLPGVNSAGVVNFLPFVGDWGGPFGIDGVGPLPRSPQGWEASPVAWYRAIDGDYFRAMRIRLIKGRYFTKQECESGAGVAIVNQTLARDFFPDGDALGRRLRFADSSVEEGKKRLLEIVGVVADVKEDLHSLQSAGPHVCGLCDLVSPAREFCRADCFEPRCAFRCHAPSHLGSRWGSANRKVDYDAGVCLRQGLPAPFLPGDLGHTCGSGPGPGDGRGLRRYVVFGQPADTRDRCPQSFGRRAGRHFEASIDPRRRTQPLRSSNRVGGVAFADQPALELSLWRESDRFGDARRRRRAARSRGPCGLPHPCPPGDQGRSHGGAAV